MTGSFQEFAADKTAEALAKAAAEEAKKTPKIKSEEEMRTEEEVLT
jgi:hypothetical protein